MSYLVDTSILVRTVHAENPLRLPAIESLARLRSRGEKLYVFPQNLIEFWAVATRPNLANGLGLTVDETEAQIVRIKLHFILKPENETIFDNWENLVKTHRVTGKPTHDARIVAMMQTHEITRLLTFNVDDFKRLWIHHFHRIPS